MAAGLSFQIIGQEELERKLTSSLWKKPLRKLFTRATEIAENKAKNEAPKDTGSMARNIQSNVSTTKATVSLPRNLDYYHVMEYGRKPGGRMPPLDAIAGWLRRKGSNANAFVVARSIARRGIKGRFFMRQGFVATQKAMPKLLRKMGDEVGLIWQD
jgi:hypothetical protein